MYMLCAQLSLFEKQALLDMLHNYSCIVCMCNADPSYMQSHLHLAMSQHTLTGIHTLYRSG